MLLVTEALMWSDPPSHLSPAYAFYMQPMMMALLPEMPAGASGIAALTRAVKWTLYGAPGAGARGAAARCWGTVNTVAACLDLRFTVACSPWHPLTPWPPSRQRLCDLPQHGALWRRALRPGHAGVRPRWHALHCLALRVLRRD